MTRSESRGRGDIAHPSALPFLLVHLGCLAVVWSGITWPALALGLVLYWLRMFAVTAGYHRYFSHRSYGTGRVFQFLLAFLAQSTGQKSALWWAAHHRHHHRHSDTEDDLHSPVRGGFFHSHIGWVLDRRNDETDLVRVDDLARYPELRWLHRYEGAPPILLAAACFLVAGWPGLVIGFCWSTVLVYHATFCINSLAHVHGRRRYVTGDQSRNNWALAIITMGEGWHNNHHACQSSARQGFRCWEVDLTYYILKGLAAVRVVWDLKAPPDALLRGEQPPSVGMVRRTAEQLAARFDPITTANQIRDSGAAADWARWSQISAQNPERSLPHLSAGPLVPGRDAFERQARSMFAQTPAFDQIVDMAHLLFLRAVVERLTVAPQAALAAPTATQP
ncbi:MAG: acyl-CoA desaturase [Caulobacter sp.]|nr:acyl-CoA desaturase [Caulobacter sp.]